jgi:hypothetical protein
LSAAGFRVLDAVGIESEAELAFAGLHQLLHPVVDRLDSIPPPQAAALRAAFGLSDEPVEAVGAGVRAAAGNAGRSSCAW